MRASMPCPGAVARAALLPVCLVVWSLLGVPRAAASERREETGARVWATGSDWEVLPRLVAFDDTEIGVGVEATVMLRHGYEDARLSLMGARLEVEEPDDRFRFRFSRILYERRIYSADRTYWALGGGWHFFNPRPALREYNGAQGEARGFALAALGRQVGRLRAARRWFPVVLRVGYMHARPYRFPSALPSGVTEIDPSGLNASVSLSFRF